MIAKLLPAHVVTVEADAQSATDPLHPDEARCVVRVAEKRRREFTAGRSCARRALAALGVRDGPLLPGPDRAPRWPDGIAGSITHCADYCAAAVTRTSESASLGVDVEEASPLGADLLPLICTPLELSRLSERPPQGVDGPKLVFSAKESFYKCYYPLAGTLLDFLDVEVAIDGHRFSGRLLDPDVPSAAGVRQLHGRWACDGERVYTAVTLPAAEAEGKRRS